jgi:hypothetical protein
MKIIMSKGVDLDCCMTAAILLADQKPEDSEIVLRDKATQEELYDASIACIECGLSGRTDLNDWDHHYYNNESKTDPLPPACIQAGYHKFFKLPMIIQAIGAWDEGKEFKELGECRDIFSGMLLSIKNTKEQAMVGIRLCQKWLRGDFLPSVEEIRWMEVKEDYDMKVEESLEKANLLQSRQGKTIAYLESEFWGSLQACQTRLDDEDIVIVQNPSTRKITVALKPQSKADLKEVCEILNRVDPGWGGPISGKIIGSPHAGTKLVLDDVVDVVRIFM